MPSVDTRDDSYESRLDDLKRAAEDFALHLKLLRARIEDLRAEMRSASTKAALLNGLERRR